MTCTSLFTAGESFTPVVDCIAFWKQCWEQVAIALANLPTVSESHFCHTCLQAALIQLAVGRLFSKIISFKSSSCSAICCSVLRLKKVEAGGLDKWFFLLLFSTHCVFDSCLQRQRNYSLTSWETRSTEEQHWYHSRCTCANAFTLFHRSICWADFGQIPLIRKCSINYIA